MYHVGLWFLCGQQGARFPELDPLAPSTSLRATEANPDERATSSQSHANPTLYPPPQLQIPPQNSGAVAAPLCRTPDAGHQAEAAESATVGGDAGGSPHGEAIGGAGAWVGDAAAPGGDAGGNPGAARAGVPAGVVGGGLAAIQGGVMRLWAARGTTAVHGPPGGPGPPARASANTGQARFSDVPAGAGAGVRQGFDERKWGGSWEGTVSLRLDIDETGLGFGEAGHVVRVMLVPCIHEGGSHDGAHESHDQAGGDGWAQGAGLIKQLQAMSGEALRRPWSVPGWRQLQNPDASAQNPATPMEDAPISVPAQPLSDTAQLSLRPLPEAGYPAREDAGDTSEPSQLDELRSSSLVTLTLAVRDAEGTGDPGGGCVTVDLQARHAAMPSRDITNPNAMVDAPGTLRQGLQTLTGGFRRMWGHGGPSWDLQTHVSAAPGASDNHISPQGPVGQSEPRAEDRHLGDGRLGTGEETETAAASETDTAIDRYVRVALSPEKGEEGDIRVRVRVEPVGPPRASALPHDVPGDAGGAGSVPAVPPVPTALAGLFRSFSRRQAPQGPPAPAGITSSGNVVAAGRDTADEASRSGLTQILADEGVSAITDPRQDVGARPGPSWDMLEGFWEPPHLRGDETLADTQPADWGVTLGASREATPRDGGERVDDAEVLPRGNATATEGDGRAVAGGKSLDGEGTGEGGLDTVGDCEVHAAVRRQAGVQLLHQLQNTAQEVRHMQVSVT